MLIVWMTIGAAWSLFCLLVGVALGEKAVRAERDW